MPKKKPPESSLPSKAYLVSFGDTMTALLAFFIVLNSLAKEQTGANMYSGTGSFVNAFSNSGLPGGLPSDRSSEMIQQLAPMPIYALADNLDKNEEKVGPDDTTEKEDVADRDHEQFQKFLTNIEDNFGLEKHDQVTDQSVFDSFERFNRETGGLSRHAIKILTESIAKLRDDDVSLEVIVWATIPSKANLEIQLKKSNIVRDEVMKRFWIKQKDLRRIRFRVKPWLFADAKRPILSVVVSHLDKPKAGSVASATGN